jgi:hypothetical protein
MPAIVGPVASWTVDGGTEIRFPIVGQLRETGGARLVQHERPYRQGAKLDSTGSRARSWVVQILLNNSVREPGLEDVVFYPGVVAELVASFEGGAVGTLILPTVGKVRARPGDYDRLEDVQARDEAQLSVTWVEDNEEGLDRAQLTQPSARGSLVRLAEQTKFTADMAGASDADLAGQVASISGAALTTSLLETAAEIEGLLLAPGRAIADLEGQVRGARAAVRRVRSAQEQLAEDVLGLPGDPRGSSLWRLLLSLEDTHAGAVDEKFRSLPRTRPFVVDVERTTLFAIAARFGQNAGDLLDLNSGRVGNPLSLERGTVVLVFA